MKKIMFNDKYGLTKAVLEGRKTQTRRIINLKEQLIRDYQLCYYNNTFDFLDGLDLIDCYYANNYEKLPFKIGEIVAIAQSYKDIFSEFSQHPNPQLNIGVKNPTDTAGWTNKMFVRSEIMPHQIRITNVRIQRLQDISYEDCIKEGIRKDVRYSFIENVKQSDGDNLAFSCNFNSPREAYAALIDKVSGKGTWHSNPFVFVYDFELIK